MEPRVKKKRAVRPRNPIAEAELFAHLVHLGKMTADDARHEIWMEERVLVVLRQFADATAGDAHPDAFSWRDVEFRASVLETFEVLAARKTTTWCRLCHEGTE